LKNDNDLFLPPPYQALARADRVVSHVIEQKYIRRGCEQQNAWSNSGHEAAEEPENRG
jgi:hypothetical protein